MMIGDASVADGIVARLRDASAAGYHAGERAAPHCGSAVPAVSTVGSSTSTICETCVYRWDSIIPVSITRLEAGALSSMYALHVRADLCSVCL
jgi:hypothetical protein